MIVFCFFELDTLKRKAHVARRSEDFERTALILPVKHSVILGFELVTS